MNTFWMIAALGAAMILLFLWPMSFAAAIPACRSLDLWFKEGTTRVKKELKPGSEHYGRIMELLGQHSYRRTPSGVFGAAEHDPNCRRLTLVCGDCAITIREDGTVSVDGQSYAMRADHSKSLVDAVQGIVTQ